MQANTKTLNLKALSAIATLLVLLPCSPVGAQAPAVTPVETGAAPATAAAQPAPAPAPAPATAQGAPVQGAPARNIDPAVVQLIEQGIAGLNQMKSGYLEVTGSLDVVVPQIQKKINFPLHARVWYLEGEPAFKMYVLMQYLGLAHAMITDGKQDFNYYPTLGEYTLKPSKHQGGTSGADAALASLAPTTSSQELLAGFHTATMVGKETVDGQSAQRIRLEGEEFKGDVWFSDSPQPLPIKVNGTTNSSRAPIEISATSKWMVNLPVPETTFAITPPEGARQVATVDKERLAPDMSQALASITAERAAAQGGAGAAAPAGGGSGDQKPVLRTPAPHNPQPVLQTPATQPLPQDPAAQPSLEVPPAQPALEAPPEQPQVQVPTPAPQLPAL